MTVSQTVHIILVNRATGEPAALLIEREPGSVEFPSLALAPHELEDQALIAARIRERTGLDVNIAGFLQADVPQDSTPTNDQFLVARVAGGTLTLAIPHVGWEWRPMARLLPLQLIREPVANELSSNAYG